MSKVCDKCSRYFDDSLEKCPYCDDKSAYNVKNMFLEAENNINFKNTNVINDTNNMNNDIFDLNKKEIKEDNTKNQTIIIEKDKEDNKKNSIIFMQETKEEVKNNLEKKNEKISKDIVTNKKRKIKKESSNMYSYLTLILSFILLFITVLMCTIKFEIFAFIHYVITSFLLILTFRLSLDNKSGYYLGIIASFFMILMIIEKDYTNFIVGIYLFFASFTNLIRK